MRCFSAVLSAWLQYAADGQPHARAVVGDAACPSARWTGARCRVQRRAGSATASPTWCAMRPFPRQPSACGSASASYPRRTRPQADRRAGRHRVPAARAAAVAGVRRSGGVAVPGDRAGDRGGASRSGRPRRRLPVPRDGLPAAGELRRQPARRRRAGLVRRLPHPGRAALRQRAAGAGARQPRGVRPQRHGLVPLLRPARFHRVRERDRDPTRPTSATCGWSCSTRRWRRTGSRPAPRRRVYRPQFARVRELAQGARTAWFVTHRPPYTNEDERVAMDGALDAVRRRCWPAHIHFFAMNVWPTSRRPLPPLLDQRRGRRRARAEPRAGPALRHRRRQGGGDAVRLRPTSASRSTPARARGWAISLRDADGKERTRCTLVERTVRCS